MTTRPESILNLTGKTRYLDDLPEPAGLLHAIPVPSGSARGRGLSVDPSAALALAPGIRVFTAPDIPGENQLGVAVADEPLLASGTWEYWGQAVALVTAPTRSLARRAAALVRVAGTPERPVVDAREAFKNGDIILTPRTMRSGDVEGAFAKAAFTAEGRVESGGQEHVYLETQGAIAYPGEDGRIRVISGTQAPTGVQRAIARVLGLPANLVEVETGRLGGGFGGKEDQAAPWACLAALAASLTGRPVKLYLSRKEDMRMTGKRHPYSTDFRIALDAKGAILGFEADYYQNSGACTDLSPAILSRTLFHAASAYRIPALRVTGYMCRTNLPPFTAFRGFGAPQAIFVVESAIAASSRASGIPAVEIQRRNLLREGDVTHYGMRLEDCRAGRAFDRLMEHSGYGSVRAGIDAFNAANSLVKRGAWVLPICFGVSFTKLMMNQGGALVHAYGDGSVSVSTGAVEMGQGVGRKILVAAARALRIDESLVRIERTSTLTVANTMPTAASTGTDINGMAAIVACAEIRGRLDRFAEKAKLDREDWKPLVARAHEARVDLSAHGFWATPGLAYDDRAERGHPFAYHVYGAALVVAELDVVRGSYRVVRSDIVHDGGTPIDPLVDRGQLEGGFAQGLGWSLLEDLRYDGHGRLMSDTLSTYKVPDAHFMDFPIDIELLADADNPKAILGSKAVGEPPLLYGIAGYFAVLDALNAARPGESAFDLPMTPEKALFRILGDA